MLRGHVPRGGGGGNMGITGAAAAAAAEAVAVELGLLRPSQHSTCTAGALLVAPSHGTEAAAAPAAAPAGESI